MFITLTVFEYEFATYTLLPSGLTDTPAGPFPTGIVVQAREERFQEQNRVIALSLLRSKLWEKEEEEKLKTIAGYRSVIGRGMRSEKIRTYNFPQDRVTDHRLAKSWGNLEVIVEGNLEKVIALTKTIVN